MEDKSLVHDPASTPGDSFLYREDYLLFGLLVRHGLVRPEDQRVLMVAQREQGDKPSLANILAKSSNLPEKSRRDIDELLRILATPELRKLLPGELPDVRTLVETLQSTDRGAGAGYGVTDADQIASTTRKVGAAGASEATTHLTKDEQERVERSRGKSDMIGTELAGHIVIDRLGSGGQGDVYLAKQLSLNRYVALKKLYIPAHARADDFVDAFRKEAQTLGRINHARIVKVFEIFTTPRGVFFTMEHLNGSTIKDLFLNANGPMRLDVVANLACQACSALGRTSQDGLVHRDIKPANLMLDENGDLKIVDFGLAGLAANFGLGEGFSGTPHFASPEQVQSAPLTPLSDMYSLGLTLYACATGSAPFQAGDVNAILRKQVDESPPVPSLVNPDLPRSVDRVIMRMIEKDPSRRFATFDDCFTEWEKVLREATGTAGAGAQLLGEELLRFGRKEKNEILNRSLVLGVAWLAVATGTVLGEYVLRRNGMEWVLDWCGKFGSGLLVFSLCCIFYVAAARRHWLPVVGSLRAWLYTHIATAVPSVALILVHSGNFLNGIMPGPPDARPVLSLVMSFVLIVTAVSGSVGLMIFRGLRKQLQLHQMDLRGSRVTPREAMYMMLSAQFLSGWRLVHYPLAIFFILMAILHVVQSLRFAVQ